MNKLSVTSEPVISVCDVSDSVSRQKRNKAPGPDGIRMEAFIFAGHRLRVLLSILFDMFIKCSHVPSAFCESTIVPLVKCKTRDLRLQMLITTEQLLSLMLSLKFLSTSSTTSLLMKRM